MLTAAVLFSMATADVGVADKNSAVSELVTQFETVCSNLLDFETIRKSALANGWQYFNAKPESTHAKMTAGMKQLDGVESLKLLDFSKSISGSMIILSISTVDIENGNALTCRMHNYSATRPFSEAAVSKIVGAKPVETQNDSNLTARLWLPGLAADHTSLQTLYVPPNSPLVEKLFFKGAMLIARKKKGLN